MVREDTVICMDNSEWMRNGDYTKNRFDAQYQAIEYIIKAKTSAHPENTVGLISLAGGSSTGAQVLCSPTKEKFRVGKAAQTAPMGGKVDIITGLKLAQLALKFRPERSIQARVILFVGSPVNSIDLKKFTKAGKDLKKNNIAVDVIAVGELDDNVQILEKFLKAVEKRDGASSTLITVPPGTYIEDSIAQSGMGGNEEQDMDPLLAIALAESRAEAGIPSTTPVNTATTSKPATQEQAAENVDMEVDEDEDEIYRQAILMSLAEANNDNNKGTGAAGALNENLAENLLKSVGVDTTSKEVKEELEELKKAEKKDKDKEDKKD